MISISVIDLMKTFRSKIKNAGFSGSLKSLVIPKYQTIKAVDGISFELDQGQILGFIGPNGAGKSTTIKILTGILHPTSGDVTVLGYCPWKQRRELTYHLGTVFGQRPQLWYHLPAIDTFHLFARIFELDDVKAKKRIAFLAEAFEIQNLLQTPVRKLSLGQRMRCEVAASLLHEPKILLLDEPSIGLDVVAKQRIRDTVRQMNEIEGTTVLLTSHDAGDLEALCRQVIIINHGHIIYRDKVSNLKRSFLTSKLVEVRFAEEIKQSFNIPGTELLKIGKYGVKLRFDPRQTEIEAVISQLASTGTLVDATFSDPSMEEVIRAIYNEAG